MSNHIFQILSITTLLLTASSAHGQYNKTAGVNAPTRSVTIKERDARTGAIRKRIVQQKVSKDGYGNAHGNQYDLAVDGAFEGQTVAVIHLYTGEGFDFSLPKKALQRKGFSVFRWINRPPSPKVLEESLKKANQLWVISGNHRQLNDEHLKVIKEFFEAGHGVYIWGDNDPYYADANFLGEALIGASMKGNLPGYKTVGLQMKLGKQGLMPNHLLSTGLEHIFEGVTIATIQPNETLEPFIYGSANNLVTGIYEKNGRRAIFDGGFTRLYIHWDTAGTARYVKNAAAWLANYEKFGDKIVSKKATPKG